MQDSQLHLSFLSASHFVPSALHTRVEFSIVQITRTELDEFNFGIRKLLTPLIWELLDVVLVCLECPSCSVSTEDVV